MTYVIFICDVSVKKMKETYVIDLYKIKGNGEFKCPKCRTKISPNDLSEDVYTITETQVKEDRLEKVILRCNKCGSKLHIIGFEASEPLD
jgi:Zn finger protein HypA/HybF involved in hydrogenase expression